MPETPPQILKLDPYKYREEIKSLASRMRVGEKILLIIDLRSHNIINNVIRVCRENNLSVIDGYDREKEIILVAVKR
ncbi:MAG: hypothetical protein ABWJ42_04630 [Sulfolobales archaeon]